MSPPRIAVIGAGAAGMTAAVRAAEHGAHVMLLNAHPRIGLKILMSGGTRCNVTHREVSERDFHGGSRPFIARVLRAFTPDETRAWFAAMGVELKLEPTGKYFPVTDDAQTVLDALLAAVERAGVEVRGGARVVRVERGAVSAHAPGAGEGGAAAGRDARAGERGAAHGAAHVVDEGAVRSTVERSATEAAPGAAAARFRLGIQRIESSAALGGAAAAHGVTEWALPAAAPDHWLEADAVILASGGLSFPRTGSDGAGYAIARALGHTLVPPVPALTPLAADDALCREAQGVTLEAELALWVEGRVAERVRGSLLIAHFGFSGPAALDLSRHWHRAEGARERRVTVSFASGATLDSLRAEWTKAAAHTPALGARRFLAARVPERIAALLCAEASVAPGAAVSQVPREARDALLRRVVERPLAVTGTLGYEKAEVTAGGVTLSEVNPGTLESRVCPGFFLCGEVLDVEGRLGGFNFQWAWSSGTVAGRGAVARLARA